VIIDTLVQRDCLRNFAAMKARAAGLALLSRQVTLPPVPESAAVSRQWSRQTMADWRLDEIADVAAQLVSELVTNSIEHAQTACVRLMLIHAAATLWIDVRDDDTASLPARRLAGPYDVRGRGLVIIEAMSARWGVSVTEAGKSVWCELATPPAGSAPQA
jgi:serine/threonine-protein kinase RsbW